MTGTVCSTEHVVQFCSQALVANAASPGPVGLRPADQADRGGKGALLKRTSVCKDECLVILVDQINHFATKFYQQS